MGGDILIFQNKVSHDQKQDRRRSYVYPNENLDWDSLILHLFGVYLLSHYNGSG